MLRVVVCCTLHVARINRLAVELRASRQRNAICAPVIALSGGTRAAATGVHRHVGACRVQHDSPCNDHATWIIAACNNLCCNVLGAVPRLPSARSADASALALSSAVAPAGALRRSVRLPVRMLPCAARRSLLQAPAAGAARLPSINRSAVRTVATRMRRTHNMQHTEAPQRNVRQRADG